MQRRPCLALLASALVMLACSESPGPSELKSRPSFDANPNSSGATIERYEDIWSLSIYDADQQLLAYHSWRNAFPACGTPATEFSFADVMNVASGIDPSLVHQLFTADPAYIWVWHSTNGSVLQARCTQPIAKGTGKVIYTDSDIFAFLANDRMRADAFGFAAQGDLTGADGTAYKYNGVHRWKWQPNSGDSADRYFMTMHITLTPLGQN